MDPDLTLAAAARKVGSKASTVRSWKARDEEFRTALERRDEMLRDPNDPPPAAGEISRARERYERAMAVCADIGPGPWNVKTKADRAWRTGAYTDNRQAAIEAIAELRRLGVIDDLPAPPELNPYPKDRRPRNDDSIDIAEYRRRYMPGSGALRPEYWPANRRRTG
jgi:hypothetical protein